MVRTLIMLVIINTFLSIETPFAAVKDGGKFGSTRIEVTWSDHRSTGGDVRVNGYIRKDGTEVAPHMRSHPDGNPYDNWSTRGNVNPYTGMPGTHSPHSKYSYMDTPSQKSYIDGNSYGNLSSQADKKSYTESPGTYNPPMVKTIDTSPSERSIIGTSLSILGFVALAIGVLLFLLFLKHVWSFV